MIVMQLYNLANNANNEEVPLYDENHSNQADTMEYEPPPLF